MLSGFIRQPLTIALAIPTAFKLASRTFRPSIASLTTNVNKEDRVPEPTTASPPPPQKRPARRRGINKSLGGDGTQQQQSMPTLADFIHRAKVRQQYRNFIRLAHFVDGTGDGSASTRPTGECRAALEEVRLSFKMGMKKAIDSLSRKMAFAEVRADMITLLGIVARASFYIYMSILYHFPVLKVLDTSLGTLLLFHACFFLIMNILFCTCSLYHSKNCEYGEINK